MVLPEFLVQPKYKPEKWLNSPQVLEVWLQILKPIMQVLWFQVMIEKFTKVIPYKEPELLLMYLSEKVCLVEFSMLQETPSMVKVPQTNLTEEESNQKPPVLSLDNPQTNLCKLVQNLQIVQYLLEEVKENQLLVIDKPVKPLLLLIPSLTKKQTSKEKIEKKIYIVFMQLLDKKDPPLLTLLVFQKKEVPQNTPLLQPLPLLIPLLYNSQPLILVVLSENISEIMENTLQSSMTIYPNKPLLIDKCPYYQEDPPEEKLILVMCSIYIPDYQKELLKCTILQVEDLQPPYPLLKPKLVMYPLISLPTLFPLPMVKFSQKPNYSSKVSDPLLMQVYPYLEQDLPLKLKLLNKQPVNQRSNQLNTEKQPLLLNLVPIQMPPPNLYQTEVKDQPNYQNKTNMYLWPYTNKYVLCSPEPKVSQIELKPKELVNSNKNSQPTSDLLTKLYQIESEILEPYLKVMMLNQEISQELSYKKEDSQQPENELIINDLYNQKMNELIDKYKYKFSINEQQYFIHEINYNILLLEKIYLQIFIIKEMHLFNIQNNFTQTLLFYIYLIQILFIQQKQKIILFTIY